MYGEKAWRQLCQNALSNIEQVMEATPNKASRKLSKLNEQDMQETAGEVRTNS